MRTSILFILGSLCVGVSAVMSLARKTPPAVPTDGEAVDALHSVLPLVRFECRGRPRGYYGDMDFGCTVFHFCSEGAQRFTYKCNQGLKFNEMTTSCSAGYFGDCSHPELTGPAGSNRSSETAPVQSFQKIPIYMRPEEEQELDDPGDYPEPFIQHYDPALDLDYNYEYYDIEEPVLDALTAPSNKVARSTHVKRSPAHSFESPMTSALSAFASLANIQFDLTSTKDLEVDRADTIDRVEYVDRADTLDRVEYVDSVDRSFIARPPPRRRTSHTHSSGSQILQLPFLSNTGKKTTRGQHIIKSHQQRPRLRQHSGTFDQFPQSEFEGPSVFQEPSDYFDYNQPARETTPDTFRPSSLLTNDPDDFQPVTQASKESTSAREALDLVRPLRNARPRNDRHAVSTIFQNFSPTPPSFSGSAGRFPAQSSFSSPQTSPRAFNTPTHGFFDSPHFPSNGNFIFQQSPHHSTVFNQPFHHSLSPPTNSFHSPSSSRRPTQTFNIQTSSQGDQDGPQLSNSGQTFRQPIGQNFGRPQSPQPVQSFHLPPRSHATSSVGLPSSPHPGHSFSSSISPPNPGQNFRTPGSSPQHINTFNLPGLSQSPSPFLRPQSTVNFGRPETQHFSIPTPPPFITTTQAPIDSFTHSTTEFQERPRVRGQSRPQLHPQIPSQLHPQIPSQLHPQIPQQLFTDFPPLLPTTSQTERPFTTLGTQEPPVSILREPDQRFAGTTSPVPVTSQKPGILEGFDFQRDVTQQRQPVRPVEQDVRRPASDQRQTTRRRPVTTQPSRQTSRRRPSRPRRPTTPPTTEPTFTSELEDPHFNEQFEQPARRRPGTSRVRPQPFPQTTTLKPFPTTPFNTELPEIFPTFPGPPRFSTPASFPGSVTHQPPNVFESGFPPQHHIFDSPTGFGSPTIGPQQLPNDLHLQTDIRGQPGNIHSDISSGVEGLEESTNIIHPPADAPQFDEVETERPTTEAPKLPTGARQPTTRRRPSLRNRLQTRLNSRTTTRAPVQPQTKLPDYDYPEEALATTQPPPTEATTEATTTRPKSYREKIRERLNRLNSRRRNGASSNTRTEGNISDSTTAAPRRVSIRPATVDKEKFNRFRNRLRSRARSRLATTEAPKTETDEGTTEAPVQQKTTPITSGLRRLNNGFRSQRFKTEGESVLQVKEILKSDQDVQETTHLEVSERPEVNQQTIETKPAPQETKDFQRDPQEIATPWAEESNQETEHHNDNTHKADAIEEEEEQLVPQDTDQESQLEETKHHDTQQTDNQEEATTEEDNQRGPGFVRGRRISDPNFRARFREFLKNRKNRVSARYRTTEEPSTQDGQEDNQEEPKQENPNQEDHEQETHMQEELKQEDKRKDEEQHDTPQPVIRERTAQTLEEQRKELRTMLLANRQKNNEERISRRVPIRPFKNKFTNEDKNTDEEETITGDEIGSVDIEARETPTAEPELGDDVKPDNIRTFAGFRPVIDIPSKTLIPKRTQPKTQEPEIITAPPQSEKGPNVMTFTVSADLSGKVNEKREVAVNTKTQTPSAPPPSVMIVREIGINSPEETEKPEPSEPRELSPEFNNSPTAPSGTHTNRQDTFIALDTSNSGDVPVLIPIHTPLPISASSHGDNENTKTPTQHLESKLLVPFHKRTKSSPLRESLTTLPTKSPGSGILTPLPLAPRSSKPSFNLAAALGRPRIKKPNTEQQLDEEEEEVVITPFPKITMATDSPRLPLELLLPLYKTR